MRLLQVSRIAVLPLGFLAFAAASCRDFSPRDAAVALPKYVAASAPDSNTIFTSTREVRALKWDGKALWAATAGGVLRFEQGKWSKWTRANGLPSQEAMMLEELGVRFPVALASWEKNVWKVSARPQYERPSVSANWQGKKVTAVLDELQIAGRQVKLPPQAQGTHISALLPLAKVLLVGVYGDGMWHFDGKKWGREAGLPKEAQNVLSLAGDNSTLWLGTRREGIFQRQNGKWRQFLQENEPHAHNIQVLGEFKGVVFGSTLDDGLVLRTGKGWRHVAPSQISSSAPRQMWEWRNQFLVRHGNGVVDSFDGASWQKNALATIPRKGVYALTGDQNRLIAAGWGGWSEWDGQNWTPYYEIEALKNVPIMNVALQGDDLWIGTQSRGLGKWSRATGEFRFYDERDGLNDDWVTSLCVEGNNVWAGTFVGGLARFDGAKWHVFEEMKGRNITSLVSDGQGGVYSATRHGLWHANASGTKELSFDWLDEEMQALWHDKDGLWIGTRTSLNFLRQPQAQRSAFKAN